MRLGHRILLLLFLSFTLPQVASAAADGENFQDWYADCSNADASCRADTFVKGDNNPIGFDYRVSWLRESPQSEFVLVFNPLYEPVAEDSAITLQVNGEDTIRLDARTGYRQAGDARYLVQSVSRNLTLMEQMRAGVSMVLSYDSAEGDEVSIEVSLLGLTASLQYIESLRPAEAAAQTSESEAEDPVEEEVSGQEPAEKPLAQTEEAAEEQEEEEVFTIRLDAEWPDDLFLFEKAIAMCLDESEHKPARVGVAWVLDDQTVAVKLEPWEGDEELCLAEADGGAVLEIRPLEDSDSAPGSDATFSPIEFGKPEGCFTHEPVALEDGTPIGWLSEEGC